MPWETELFLLWKAGAELVFLWMAGAPAGFLTSVSASCLPPVVLSFCQNVPMLHKQYSDNTRGFH